MKISPIKAHCSITSFTLLNICCKWKRKIFKIFGIFSWQVAINKITDPLLMNAQLRSWLNYTESFLNGLYWLHSWLKFCHFKKPFQKARKKSEIWESKSTVTQLLKHGFIFYRYDLKSFIITWATQLLIPLYKTGGRAKYQRD